MPFWISETELLNRETKTSWRSSDVTVMDAIDKTVDVLLNK